jgi:hypothetical protein
LRILFFNLTVNSLLKIFLQGKVKHGNELKIYIPSAEDPARALYCKHADKENGKSYIEIGMYDKIFTDTSEKYMMKMHIGYAHCFLNAINKAMALYQPSPYIKWEE